MGKKKGLGPRHKMKLKSPWKRSTLVREVIKLSALSSMKENWAEIRSFMKGNVGTK
jgi:hypothetical protein